MTDQPVAGLLRGQQALIVGVGPGLGRELALRFAGAGADVILSARRHETLADVGDQVRALGRQALTVPADITSPGEVEDLFAQIADGPGRVDTVVFNAFVPPPMTPIADTSEDIWIRSFDVHVLAAARLAGIATPFLAASKGSLVFINTQAARRSEPGRGSYAATKAAQLSLARTLAGELGPAGIRVNSVVPGHIMGPALEAFLAERAARLGVTYDAAHDKVARGMALRRIATTTEVADAAVFFASPMASGITGQSLDVNAGNWFE